MSPHVVRLRSVEDTDLPAFFEHQSDPEAIAMASFASRDASAFAEHWRRIRSDPLNVQRTITVDGQVAGYICCFPVKNQHLVGYWLGREFWGRGVASAALRAFLQEVRERPLFAYVARGNAASMRVLRKCGFIEIPEEALEPPSPGAAVEAVFVRP
ncbi:MAG: GNAT family N-acetyltransferase [Thermoplasmatota archaeon]